MFSTYPVVSSYDNVSTCLRLDRDGMDECNPCSTPVDLNPKLSATVEAPIADPLDYPNLAGALHYPTFTRPNISYAIQQVCFHMHLGLVLRSSSV